MARPSNPISSPPPGASSFEKSSAELAQLLSRLQQTVLHASPEREQRLRTSEYERARLGTNLEYARTSLSKLEQDALGMLAPGRRAEAQADLNNKRELLELLLDRLQDLHKMAVDDDDDSSEGEDILADIVPTPSESTESASADVQEVHETRTTVVDTATPEPTTAPAQSTPAPTQASSSIPEPSTTAEPTSSSTPTQTSQTLRSRTSQPSQTASSDSQPTFATARAALFANRRRPDSTAAATTETSTATAEAILDQQAAEREDLADKVFHMAQAMKKQQQNIASSLDTEKDVLGRATEGMERTGRGMDAAKGRMSALTKITEGKGWWARMILYAWVYGLMLTLVLLVFVMPKLRF